MADLKSFKTDSRAIEDGVWVRVNDALYGDLEIQSRGFTDAFVDAQTQRLARAAEAYGGDQTQIPNAERRTINASLLEDFLVLDVRNLRDGDAIVDVKRFHEMLYDRDYNKLARACWDTAGRVTTRTVEQIEAAEKNSRPPSATISNGESSASVSSSEA